MQSSDVKGRRWSAASRYRLRDAEVCREKLDDLLMQNTDEVKSQKFTSLGDLLRPQTAAAVLLPIDKDALSSENSRLRVGQGSPLGKHSRPTAATPAPGGYLRLSMKDIIARKRDGSAPLPSATAMRWKPHNLNPDVMIESYEVKISTVMPGVRRQMPWLAAQGDNGIESKEEIDRTVLSSSCSNHSMTVDDGSRAGGWRRAMTPGGGGMSHTEEYDTTLQLQEIDDNAVDVFDLPQHRPNSDRAQFALVDDGEDDDSPSAVLAAALKAAKEAEEAKRVLALEENNRRAADKELILRSRLEIERFELTQELTRLRERRELLTREREIEQDRKQSAEAARQDLMQRHKATDDLVEHELAAEWAAIRKKRDEERRALRLRQNPTGAPGGPKKFFKPKFASPWDAFSAATTNRVVLEQKSAPSPLPPGCHDEFDFDDISADRRKLLAMPLELRMETLKMRCKELERWQVAVEPAARDSIASVEQACRQALTAVLHDGWLRETRERQCVMIDERNEWLSITRHASGQHSLLQIRQWAPDVFSDKQHLTSKAASEVLPPSVGASLLRQATETHRHNVRDTWDVIFSLREQLLEAQRKKRAIRETLRGLSRGFPIPSVDVEEKELRTSTSQRISTRMAEEITQQQRIEYLNAQLTQLEALEMRLKNEIAEKGDRVW